MPAIVRQRRYVSASPGSYPPPVPPRREQGHGPSGGGRSAEDPRAATGAGVADIGAAIDASLAAPAQPAEPPPSEPSATGPARSGDRERGLEGQGSEPVEASSPDPFAPPAPEDAEFDASAQPATEGEQREPFTAPAEGKRRSGAPLAGMLVGGALGAVIGSAAGLLLLALTQGQGPLMERLNEPAAVLAQLTDPVALWNGVPDWLIRMSAVLVSGGFLLLGIGWGGRLGSRRRS